MNTNEPKDGATARPWLIGSDFTLNRRNEVVTKDGLTIADCPRYGAGLIETGEVAPWHSVEANAALIVRAVNQHDALRRVAEAASFFIATVPLASMSAVQLLARRDFTTALAALDKLKEGQ